MDSPKPKVIWIFGRHGLGKGTKYQALIAKYLDYFYHISTGSFVCQAFKEQRPDNTEILELMKQGNCYQVDHLLD